MDEARQVLERLDRIENLRRAAVAPQVLLGEVRSLLVEAEAWIRADPAGNRAERALDRVREAVLEGEAEDLEVKRTLVA